MRMSAWILVCAAGFSSLTAFAQDSAAIAKVRVAPGFRSAAEADFRHYEQGLASHCAAVTVDWSHATDHVYGQPQTGSDGNLVNATWVESVPGTACGEARRFRVLMTIRGGAASVTPLLPGDSFAGPQLEASAQQSLGPAVAAYKLAEDGQREHSFQRGSALEVDDCGTGSISPDAGPPRDPTALFVGKRNFPLRVNAATEVTDTRLAGPAPTAGKQPWNEVWTVKNCGRKLTVPIQFVPDAVGEGTSIHIASKEIKAIP